MSESRLRGFLDELVERREVAHAVMAVERGDGSFRWAGAAGDADGAGTPMRETTPYHVASVTKPYTAAAILRLHERGALSIEQPITDLLPASVTDGLHRLGGTDHTPEITVRHLLQHTSGLANYFEDRPRGGKSLGEEVFDGADRTWTIEECSERVRMLRPHFPPGRRIRYSDTNFQLLGAIAAAVTGNSYQRVVRDELLEPLGLRSTWFPGDEPDGAPAAARLFAGGRPLEAPGALRSVAPDGGLVSTVDDGIAFLRALFGGAVFERPETLRAMTSGWRRFGLPTDAAAIRAPSWPIQYALGTMRFQLPRAFTGFRRLPALIGHTGSTGSWLFHAPDANLYLAGTVDEVSSGAVPYRLLPKVLRALT